MGAPNDHDAAAVLVVSRCACTAAALCLSYSRGGRGGKGCGTIGAAEMVRCTGGWLLAAARADGRVPVAHSMATRLRLDPRLGFRHTPDGDHVDRQDADTMHSDETHTATMLVCRLLADQSARCSDLAIELSFAAGTDNAL